MVNKFEDTIEAEVEIRARTKADIVTDLRELIESLDAEYLIIQTYKQQWLTLLDMIENPIYQLYPQLQTSIYTSIQNTAYSLRLMHTQRESLRASMPWIPSLMSGEDYESLGEVTEEIELLNEKNK